MTDRNTWKGLERKTAKILGGERIPCSGLSGTMLRGDVFHERFFIECKFRQKFLVYSLFNKVRGQAKNTGKIPLLVLKEKYKKGELIVLDLIDFQKLMGMEKDNEDVLEK